MLERVGPPLIISDTPIYSRGAPGHGMWPGVFAPCFLTSREEVAEGRQQ